MSTDADKIAAIAAEADATIDEPMPTDVAPTRPNKSVVVAVRLTPEDAVAIEALATRTEMPVSALLRTWITAGLASSQTVTVSSTVERLSADLAQLRQQIRAEAALASAAVAGSPG